MPGARDLRDPPPTPGVGSGPDPHELERNGFEPLPSESSIYRCLKRHNLVELRSERS